MGHGHRLVTSGNDTDPSNDLFCGRLGCGLIGPGLRLVENVISFVQDRHGDGEVIVIEFQ